MEDEELYEDEGRSSNGFVITAGILGSTFLLLLVALVVIRGFMGDGGEDPDVAAANATVAAESTAISATNEAILAQNARVTETIIAAATINSYTPTPPPTATPTFTPTPSPTLSPSPSPSPTSVIEEEATETPAPDDTPNAAATSIFNNVPTVPPNTGSSGSGSTGSGSTGGSGGTGGGTLPQTGISLWGSLLATFAFLALFIAARRLRTK